MAAKEFGSLIRQYRLQAFMTQAMLAEKCFCSQAYVSLLERGLREPPGRFVVNLIARALNLTYQQTNVLSAAGSLPASVQGSDEEPLAVSPVVSRLQTFLSDQDVPPAEKNYVEQVVDDVITARLARLRDRQSAIDAVQAALRLSAREASTGDA